MYIMKSPNSHLFNSTFLCIVIPFNSYVINNYYLQNNMMARILYQDSMWIFLQNVAEILIHYVYGIFLIYKPKNNGIFSCTYIIRP